MNPWAMAGLDATVTAGLLLGLWQRRPTPPIRWRRVVAAGSAVAVAVAVALVHTGTVQRLRSAVGGDPVYLDPQLFDLGEHPAGATMAVSARLHNRSPGPVRVVGMTQSGFAAAGPGLIQTIPAGAAGDVPLVLTIRGEPGRRVGHTAVFCEIDGRLRPLVLTAGWTVVAK